MRRTRRFAQAPYVSSFIRIHEVCVCWANRKAQRTSVVDTLSRNWYSAGWVVHVFNRRLFHYGMYDKLYLQVCYKVHACYNGKDRSNANRIVSILIWYNKTYMKKFRDDATAEGAWLPTCTWSRSKVHQGLNAASSRHLIPSSSRAWSHLWTGNAFVKMSAACSSVGT